MPDFQTYFRHAIRTALLLCALAVTSGQGGPVAQGQERGSGDAETPAPVIDASSLRQLPVLPDPSTVSSAAGVIRTATRAPAATGFPAPRDAYSGLLRDAPPAPGAAAPGQLPPGFVPWWSQAVQERLSEPADTRPVDIDALIVSALACSPRVRAISDDVLIQETNILEAQATFDVRAFMDSKFYRKSEPIGNLLETGGPPRLREGDWGYSAGLRKRTPLGGSWELAQKIGMRDSNSRFFAPEQQGNSRLALSFNQPLLNGFGRTYNTALIVLADIDTTVAMDQMCAALQNQLIHIAQAYWELYLQRSILIQKHRHLERATLVLDELRRRREIDALESQILRAQAAVAARQAELIRSATGIRNTEARIRALTNSPELLAVPHAELIPLDRPATVPLDVNLQDALVTALQNRPEIDAASQEIRAASVRLNMSRNELLPALDLVLETYVMGLDRDYDIGQALADQFSVGEPSYTAGLVFDVPLQRRAAKARLQRRQLQLRQLTEQFDEAVQNLMADVEIAVREVTASYQEMVGKYQAMVAAQAEVDYSTRRWQLLSGEDRSASYLLEDLLDSQDRLAVEETGFAVAQRNYTLSLTELKRATGTLLQQEEIEPVRTCQGGLPQLRFQKQSTIMTPAEVLPPAPPQISRLPDATRRVR